MILKQEILLVLIVAYCATCLADDAEQQRALGNFTNPAAVKEVLNKKRTVANAAWWGFNKSDSTDALQGAISSGANTVIVPYMGEDWIVRPIQLRSNLEMIFESGVVVTAKKGGFKYTGDCLFNAFAKHNITLRGYGATLRMQKQDYIRPNYKQGQWRHVLQLLGSSSVKVLGLTLKDSGGDGIYLGATERNNYLPCKDVLIKDCICDNNYRQGISVISAENLRIDNCIFKNTSGHSPRSGIDIEPYNANMKLTNIVVSNCVSVNNEGRGFLVGLSDLAALSSDVSILFVDCHSKDCGAGFEVSTSNNEGPQGLVEFRNCTSEDTLGPGICIVTNTRSFDLRFTNCKIKNAGSSIATTEKKYKFPVKFNFPIVLRTRRQKPFEKTGDIQFIDCYVYDEIPRPAIYVRTSGSGAINAKGTVYVQNKLAEKLVAGPDAECVSLRVERHRP